MKRLNVLLVGLALVLSGCETQETARRQGTVQITSSPTGGGTTSGGGTYNVGSVVTLQAYPAQDYGWDHWSDGVTNNPRRFTVPRGTTRFTAYFNYPQPPPVQQYGTITTQASPPGSGYVVGAGTYKLGDNAVLQAVPYTNWAFNKWQDGINLNPRSVNISSTGTFLFVANFFTNPPSAPSANVFTSWTPQQGGSVSGGGYAPVGTFLVLTATNNPGWRFSVWQDNITDNPRTVQVMTNDTTYTATFLTNVPGPHSVTLGWTYSVATNVVNYTLYIGTQSLNYKNWISVGKTNQATVTNLTAGVSYFFAVKCTDNNALDSNFSNEVNWVAPTP